jgi:predicted lipoprotein with Yx(FWY)xxD motif
VKTARLFGLLAAVAVATAACDLTDLGSYRSPAAAPAATPAPTVGLPVPRIAPAAARPPAPVLRAKAVARFGTLVVDATGRTLYRSDKDSARPPASRCAGPCLRSWRPLLVTGTGFAVAGIDPALVGTIPRAGRRQVTLAGRPLYTFAADRPGEVKGVCKVGFFPVTPEGGRLAMGG